MGLIHQAHDTGWIEARVLIHWGVPWGHTTLVGSGRWDCVMGEHPVGMRHWLDQGDGIDFWARAMGTGLGWVEGGRVVEGVEDIGW